VAIDPLSSELSSLHILKSSSLLRMQDQLAEMMKPSALLSAQLESVRRLTSIDTESFKRFADISTRLDRDLKHISSINSTLSPSIQSLLKQTESITSFRFLEVERKKFKSILESIGPTASRLSQFEALLSSSSSLDERLIKAILPLSELLKSFPLSSITPRDDGAIDIGAESVRAEVIREAIESISPSTSSSEEFITFLLAALAKLAPAAKAVFLYVLLPYFVSAIAGLNAPLHEDLWKEFRGTPRPGAKSEVRSIARDRFPSADLSDHRFVSATGLNVRETSNSRAEVVGQLKFGTTVKLLDKRKDWSFIEFWSESEEKINVGWVYSRYLAKFK